jgi:fatty-acid desaturase
MWNLVKGVLPLILVFVIRKTIDTDSADNIPYLRIAGAVLFTLQMIVWALVYRSIASRNDVKEITVKPQDLQANAVGDEKEKKITVREYDSIKLKEVVKGACVQGAMVAAIHLYAGFGLPLILQPLMGFINSLGHRLARIHVLGNATAEDLKRPWPKEPSM